MKPTFAIIPEPQSIQPGRGKFTLTANTAIFTTAGTETLGLQLAQYLRPATGLPLPIQSGLSTAPDTIALCLAPERKDLKREGYQLSATPRRVTITAATPNGIFYGVQTLRQLLPADIFRDAPIPGVKWSLPAVEITDEPRFPWRGVMLDCCRHYMPKHFIKRLIDLAALHKLNSVHLHLTEDQGWRIEIKRYPKLTQMAAWRKGSLLGHHGDAARYFDGIPHGGYYTQDDLRELVHYAASRMINLLPEIELPGHAQAAIAAYPELGVTGKPVQVRQEWGISADIYNPFPKTIQFLKNVLDEVLDIFPSAFIHIGGDEAIKDQWKASPAIQARIKALKLKDEHELQSWFIRQFDEYLQKKGRRLVGWDEILEGGLAPGATVMSWRGEEGGIAAAKAGHDVIMAPHQYTYLDHYQTEDRKHQPRQIGGFLPLEKVYQYNPIPAALTAKEAKHVLGVQTQMWTEYIPTPTDAERAMFPRTCAVSEVAWTEPARKNLKHFQKRLETHLSRLRILDVNYFRH